MITTTILRYQLCSFRTVAGTPDNIVQTRFVHRKMSGIPASDAVRIFIHDSDAN